MFGAAKVNLKERRETFSHLASAHEFNQTLPLLLTQGLSDKEMSDLRMLVSRIIEARAPGVMVASCEESGKEALKQLVKDNVGNVVELGDEKYPELTHELTRRLLNVITRTGFADSLALVQRYPNIRIKVGPFSETQEHLSHPLSTYRMHCDIWAGAPEELQICIIELLNADNGPKVEFGEVTQFPKALAQKISGYNDPEAVKFLKRRLKRTLTSEEGKLHVLDTFTPHRTIYPGNGVRVSIDFRIVLKKNMNDGLMQKLGGSQFCTPEGWA